VFQFRHLIYVVRKTWKRSSHSVYPSVLQLIWWQVPHLFSGNHSGFHFKKNIVFICMFVCFTITNHWVQMFLYKLEGKFQDFSILDICSLYMGVNKQQPSKQLTNNCFGVAALWKCFYLLVRGADYCHSKSLTSLWKWLQLKRCDTEILCTVSFTEFYRPSCLHRSFFPAWLQAGGTEAHTKVIGFMGFSVFRFYSAFLLFSHLVFCNLH